MRFVSLRTIVTLTCAAFFASGVRATESLGLYHPDFRALRALIKPSKDADETSTIPSVVMSWGRISKKGRQLLLQERDVVLVVVTPNGEWMYRTGGVPYIKMLQFGDDEKTEGDLVALSEILETKWFQELRDFYGRVLFAAQDSVNAEAIGSMLQRVEAIEGATIQQKNWFRGIVGSEVATLGDDVKRSLLADVKFGQAIVESVVLAETQKTIQQETIAKASIQGASVPLVTFDNYPLLVYSTKGYPFYSANGDSFPAGLDVGVFRGPDQDIPYYHWKTYGGTTYVVKRRNTIDVSPRTFSSGNVLRMGIGKDFDVYFAPHGTSEVFAIERQVMVEDKNVTPQ